MSWWAERTAPRTWPEDLYAHMRASRGERYARLTARHRAARAVDEQKAARPSGDAAAAAELDWAAVFKAFVDAAMAELAAVVDKARAEDREAETSAAVVEAFSGPAAPFALLGGLSAARAIKEQQQQLLDAIFA
jgi:hypothetical protein